jgi:hypothetical protein
MNTKSTTKLSTEGKIETAKARLARLKAEIAELEGNVEAAKEEARTFAKPNVVDVKIQQDEYIPVMSLLPYNLNLTTREGGQGSVKKFTKFGEVKRIIYKDLVDILEVHPNFMEAGYFYILHPGFIRHHGLNDIYSKILTKDKIEEILLANTEECVTLYSSANAGQQEIIIQLLVDKVRDNPESINLNMIDKISRVSKVDIIKRAEDSKFVDPATEQQEEAQTA